MEIRGKELCPIGIHGEWFVMPEGILAHLIDFVIGSNIVVSHWLVQLSAQME